jgi:hypothetical protein
MPMRQRLRHTALRAARLRPWLFFPLIRAHQKLGHNQGLWPVRRSTDLVVEGFFRSANTYTARALKYLNPGLDVAYHSHAPASIMVAARRQLPTVILIREPRKAVISNMLLHPKMPPQWIIDDYCLFYEAIEPLREHFLTVLFEEVADDFDAVVDRINQHFNLTLTTRRGLSDAQQEELLNAVDPYRATRESERQIGKGHLPMQAKQTLKQQAKQRIEDESLERELRIAQRIYERFSGGQ